MKLKEQEYREQVFKRRAWTAAVMLLIFVHSAMPGDLSSAESGHVVHVIAAMLRTFHIPVSASRLSFVVRKCGHFTEYAMLGSALMHGGFGRCTGFRRQTIGPSGNESPGEYAFFHLQEICSLAIGVLYAATDEIHQYFVPGRSCEFRDVCIDAAGVLAGIFLYSLCTKYRVNLRRILIAASLPAVFLLFLLYERTGGTGIKCAFYQLTGLYCPGCGSSRAISAILHGRIKEGCAHNILLPLLGIPSLLIFLHEYLRIAFPFLPLKPVYIPQGVLKGVTGLVFAFWILRNIPLFSFLAP